MSDATENGAVFIKQKLKICFLALNVLHSFLGSIVDINFRSEQYLMRYLSSLLLLVLAVRIFLGVRIYTLVRLLCE